MSSTQYTPEQISGVTNVPDRGEAKYEGEVGRDDPGEWTEDLEISIYGERDLAIPGMGEPSDRCGKWYPESFCDGEDHHVHLGQHLCGRRTCPRCWSSQWAGPRTVNVVQRLAAARYAEEDGMDRRAVHTVVSPPEGEVESASELFRYRSEAIEKAREHGVRGGVCVVHPWRVEDRIKEEFRGLLERGNWDAKEDGGIWRWIRENETHWRDQTYWSPHFHIVGLSRDVKAGTGEGGWVVKNVERGESHSLKPFHISDNEGYEDMIRVVRYLLSHAGVDMDGDRQAVTWFGELHGTNFDPEEAISEGAWEAIQRRTEELVGSEGDRPEGSLFDEEEPEPCPVDDCDGELHPIWDVPAFIDQRENDLEIEALVRLRVAFEWAIGDPDSEEAPREGWPSPRSEEEAQEAFEAIL